MVQYAQVIFAGLDHNIDDVVTSGGDDQAGKKKLPYSKPIPKSFQASWKEAPPPNAHYDGPQAAYGGGMNEPGTISLQELQHQATAVVAFGNVYPVLAGSNLYMSILSGEVAVKDVLRSEFLI